MNRLVRPLLACVLAALLAACGGGSGAAPEPGDPERGATVFGAACAACHGPEAGGTSTGPPLVHDVYRPGHHGDGAFLVAVRGGVRQHHWDFGPMPPVAGLSDQDVADATSYVRRLQEAAGID